MVDISDIFYFSLLGGGEGGVRGARRGRGTIFIENPRRGGGFPGGGAGGRGAGRVFVGNLGRGGLIFFFSGPKFPPRQKFEDNLITDTILDAPGMSFLGSQRNQFMLDVLH